MLSELKELIDEVWAQISDEEQFVVQTIACQLNCSIPEAIRYLVRRGLDGYYERGEAGDEPC
jgi:hypothetical protein